MYSPISTRWSNVGNLFLAMVLILHSDIIQDKLTYLVKKQEMCCDHFFSVGMWFTILYILKVSACYSKILFSDQRPLLYQNFFCWQLLKVIFWRDWFLLDVGTECHSRNASQWEMDQSLCFGFLSFVCSIMLIVRTSLVCASSVFLYHRYHVPMLWLLSLDYQARACAENKIKRLEIISSSRYWAYSFMHHVQDKLSGG